MRHLSTPSETYLLLGPGITEGTGSCLGWWIHLSLRSCCSWRLGRRPDVRVHQQWWPSCPAWWYLHRKRWDMIEKTWERWTPTVYPNKVQLRPNLAETPTFQSPIRWAPPAANTRRSSCSKQEWRLMIIRKYNPAATDFQLQIRSSGVAFWTLWSCESSWATPCSSKTSRWEEGI